MTTYFIAFKGTPNDIEFATRLFAQVAALAYNIRPVREYVRKNYVVIEYPEIKGGKFYEFYEQTSRRLYFEPDYNGAIPRICKPA